jgi:hypothetical protein
VTGLIETALRLPVAVYSVMLVVVITYWLVVLAGALGVDILDGDDSNLGPAGVLASFGLGGVPVSVVLSLVIAFAWFGAFVGTALISGSAPGVVQLLAGTTVFLGATVAAYLVTYLMVLPLRRMFPDGSPPSRRDFVGSTCIVRTSMVTERHGQAEVTASDGSSAIIQIRQTGEEPISAGSTALIFDYDSDGEFFWITAASTEL